MDDSAERLGELYRDVEKVGGRLSSVVDALSAF